MHTINAYIQKPFLFLISILIFSTISCSSQRSIATGSLLPATSLHPYGRTITDDNSYLELIGSAVHFGFSFEGKECKLLVSLPDTASHNYLQYELDGVYQKKIRINGNSKELVVLTATTNGRHILWIYKTTEAMTGAIIIKQISGNKLQPLEVSKVPLIEFIGNSITCGAASDSTDVPCSMGGYHDHHNGYYAYGPRVARALNLNFIMSSVSGIGVYRNWNSDGPAMPEVYEKTRLDSAGTELWDFHLYDPKIVSIALGTNDLSTGDGIKKRLPFDSSIFIAQYIKFVKLVKSKYPRAQIALLSSPMVNGKNGVLLQNCITAVQQNINALFPSHTQVAVYFFKPMQAHGCGGHPSVAEQGILADELVPFFKKLL